MSSHKVTLSLNPEVIKKIKILIEKLNLRKTISEIIEDYLTIFSSEKLIDEICRELNIDCTSSMLFNVVIEKRPKNIGKSIIEIIHKIRTERFEKL